MKYPSSDPIISKFLNIEIPLNNLMTYAKDIEEFLNNKFAESFETEEDEEDREDDDEDRDEYINTLRLYTFFEEDRYRYGIEFPNVMRTSLFYSCFAFLENYLIQLCKAVKEKKNLELDLSDIKHNGIEKAQVYLKKVAGINFPDKTKEWNYIKKCNKVRNILIHNGGTIDSEKIIKEMESIHGVNITNNFPQSKGVIYLEESFCFEFIDSIRVFITDVSKEYYALFKNNGIRIDIAKLIKEVENIKY